MPSGKPRKGVIFPSLEQRICAELSEEHELCPLCCKDWIIDGTSGYQYGVCPQCYAKAKNAALDAYAKDGRLKKDYCTARQRKSRAENSGAVPKISGRSVEPDFDTLRELLERQS